MTGPAVAEILSPFGVALRRARQREDSHNRETLYFPTAYGRDLYVTLAEQVQKSIDRIVICASEHVDPNAFHRAIWRDATFSTMINRVVYVLSHLGLMKTSVADQLRSDKEAGVNVRVVTIGDLPDSLAQSYISEAVIIDGRLAASAPHVDEPTLGGRAAWTITASGEHVAEQRRLFEALWEYGNDPDDLPAVLDLDEPLVQSAPVLSGVAPVLCIGDHVDPRGCTWYHGTWQYLRLMDLVSTPTWHHSFYRDSLLPLRDGAKRVLITGTADYSVLAYVIEAAKSSPNVAITVVDLCGTPLFACQWYAKRLGVQVETVTEDILRFAERNRHSYDVIVTDAFLTRFTDAAVDRVLAAWAGMLRPDGMIVTTIRAHAESERGQTTEEAVAAFRDRAIVRWRRWEPFIPLSREDISLRAEVYARKMISNTIGSEAQIVDTLQRHFTIATRILATVPGELFPTKYLRVILNLEGGRHE